MTWLIIFIFTVLNVRSEVNGIYMLEDCLSLNSFNYIKHWLIKCDWTWLRQLYGFFQVYANLLNGHICNSAKPMKHKYLKEWTEMAFKHKPLCHSILKWIQFSSRICLLCLIVFYPIEVADTDDLEISHWYKKGMSGRCSLGTEKE